MQQMGLIEQVALIIRPDRELRVVDTFDDETEQRYREAADAYLASIRQRPAENRCRIALFVGATHFEQKIVELQSRGRETKLADARQQLMAFSRVVSAGAAVPNSWKGIGRCFHRHHATVIYAVKKYGDAIARVIRP